jgi:FHA domain-containing protein/cohesin domain-containing protein
VNAGAQSAESIWLTSNTAAYKTGETVIVSVNGSSATPIQGFTFQIRYDAACLKPVNAASTIPGMNGLPLPQLSGLVDGSYASTTPQTVNGVLAEVRFEALKACQTDLSLESAALAVRNEQGFAAALTGVALSQTNIALTIDKEAVAAEVEVPVTGALLPLAPAEVPAARNFNWVIGLLVVAFVLGGMFVIFQYFQVGNRGAPKHSSTSAVLHVKHGPYAGQSFVLNKLPCSIGRDPHNEICLDDPHVVGRHARIFAENDSYYLMDFSGNTFINGQAVRKTSVVLKPGDVVRLGKSALFVFAS